MSTTDETYTVTFEGVVKTVLSGAQQMVTLSDITFESDCPFPKQNRMQIILHSDEVTPTQGSRVKFNDVCITIHDGKIIPPLIPKKEVMPLTPQKEVATKENDITQIVPVIEGEFEKMSHTIIPVKEAFLLLYYMSDVALLFVGNILEPQNVIIFRNSLRKILETMSTSTMNIPIAVTPFFYTKVPAIPGMDEKILKQVLSLCLVKIVDSLERYLRQFFSPM